MLLSNIYDDYYIAYTDQKINLEVHKMILNKVVSIGYFKKEKSAVIRAIDSFKEDIVKITGFDVNMLHLDEEDNIESAVKKCDIVIATKNLYCPFDEDVLNKWEGYLVKEHNGKLYISGADKRGTIYGIYEMSAYFGVSPWYYFADVPVRKKSSIVIPEGFVRSDYPSVQYRGIFLNDEEELEEWAACHTKDGTIGPCIYEKIFELILRLKGNYIWPAMHVNYFQENEKNAWLANEMGVVVGTSHCDMLMRSNQNEWNPWLKKKGYRSDYNAVHSNKIDASVNEECENIYYDYSIPGKNREVIREYWRESVEMNKDYEVCYTIGMRGVHDYGFSTKAIDEDESLSEEEKKKAKVKLLETIMEDQRQMLKTELKLNNPNEALQSFIPYKEVLDLYNNGLNVPDDVTLIWVNDNFGYIRRYPNDEERKRTGGHGLYYHASYWGTSDMSYLFFNTIPLAHMTNELRKAYTHGIRKMWVLNVGALKPLEMDMEAFLNYAWNAGKDTLITSDIHAYTARWFDSYFEGGYGEELAKLYEEYVFLTNARKIEHMQPMVFAQAGYGDEAGERLCRLEKIYERANKIYSFLGDDEKDAFFQMFLFKVHASYYVNHAFYYADRSVISYERGNDMAADCYTEYSHKMMQYLKNMLKYYNKYMCDGKWDKILTPDSFPPPGICFYPVCKPSIKRKKGGLFLTTWDGSSSYEKADITFFQNGTDRKWIELGNQGMDNVSYSITGKPSWLCISEEKGIVSKEKRIYISIKNMIDCAGNEAELYIVNNCGSQSIRLDIKVEEINNINNLERHSESDGAVCIYADEYESGGCALPLKDAGWYKIYGIGRDGGYAMMAYNQKLTSVDESNILRNPCLCYTFSLSSDGEFELEFIRFLTLDSRGRIRVGIGIDGGEPFVIESDTIDEWRGRWHDSVMNNGERLYVKLPHMCAGMHTLQLYMIDNFVTVHKMVIYTSKRHDTFFGFTPSHYMVDKPEVDWEDLDKLQKDVYCADSNIDLPGVVYADKEFWKHNRIYMKNDIVAQTALGKKRYEDYYENKGVYDITELFGSGIFVEKDGKIAIEAEYSLENSEYAYLTPDKTGEIYFSHVRAESDGGSGFAMQVFGKPYTWKEAKEAPGMHFRINVSEEGVYNVWLLMLYENHMCDSCYFAVDGEVYPLSTQYRNGQLYNYATAHMYFWCLTCEIHLPAGEHTFSIYACDTGVQIDRIYLSKGEEHPPVDAFWEWSRLN